MARTPILGAGGIVVRSGDKPLFAIVQRRKDDEWVLPKGKLKREESAVAAAEREVVEETGQDVVVGEFLGAVSYRVGRRPKVVQFWCMQACEHPARKPAKDIKAVKWLPLEAAIRKLTDPLERAFLENVVERSLAAVEPKAKLPVRKEPMPPPQTAPTDIALTPAAMRLADGQIAVLPPDQVRPKPSAVTSAPRTILGGRSAPRPAATKPAPAVAAGDVAVPVARLNLLDRILRRLWRDPTNLSQLWRWANSHARRSGR
jgi:8-oxo-dGTP diphosphatase